MDKQQRMLLKTVGKKSKSLDKSVSNALLHLDTAAIFLS